MLMIRTRRQFSLSLSLSFSNRSMSTTPTTSTLSVAASNALLVQQRIQQQQQLRHVQLVAVSKTKPAEAVLSIYEGAAQRHFGENYFQELVEKAQVLPTDIRWHFIGHLQSSKAARLVREVPGLFVVETVDSEKLAGKLNSACETAKRDSLNVYIQVDTSGEDTKSGVTDEELIPLVKFITEQCPCLVLKGLMTIGAPGDLTCFDRLAVARSTVANYLGIDEHALELSMGMSSDFEEAISRGATSVRVGSTIFGERIYPTK